MLRFMKMLGSLKLDQHKDRAILTAVVPLELLQSFTNAASTDAAPATPPPLGPGPGTSPK